MKKSLAPKKRMKNFTKFLIVYSVVLLSLMVLTWTVLYAFIGAYEEGRPSNKMDLIVEQLKNGQYEKILNESDININEFENDQLRLIEYLSEKTKDKTITYRKYGGEYTESTPVYIIYSDDKSLMKVSLEEYSKNKFKFSLWKTGDIFISDNIAGGIKKKNNDITIKVPQSSKVFINGVEANSSYIVDDNIEFEPCKNIGEYVNKPLKTIYKVSGLVMEPEISVEWNGNNLEISEEDNVYTAYYPSDEELKESMRFKISALNHAYGKYIINKGKLSEVTNNMTGNAKVYMSNIPAVWAFLYGKEYTYEFLNEEITDFTKYSDDCFSCDVYYDLYVNWKTNSTTYNTSLTYTYVLINGKWVVADFLIK